MTFHALIAGYFLIAVIFVLLFSPLLEKRLRR
jgi:hypothetical protein